jgi:hypothetical protein
MGVQLAQDLFELALHFFLLLGQISQCRVAMRSGRWCSEAASRESTTLVCAEAGISGAGARVRPASMLGPKVVAECGGAVCGPPPSPSGRRRAEGAEVSPPSSVSARILWVLCIVQREGSMVWAGVVTIFETIGYILLHYFNGIFLANEQCFSLTIFQYKHQHRPNFSETNNSSERWFLWGSMYGSSVSCTPL